MNKECKFNWKHIQTDHELGLSVKQLHVKYQIALSSLYKAIHRGDLKIKISKVNYDYTEIQKLIDEGNSYRSLQKLLGISFRTSQRAVKKGLLVFPKDNLKRMISLGKIIPKPCTDENKELQSILMTQRIRRNIRYSKMELYNGVWLESSYESIVARELDKNGIEWIRPKYLKWNDDGQIRRYLPDFYLPKYDVYLDPKNDFLIKKDARKINLAIEYNAVRIIILNKSQLLWEEIAKLV